jgi:plastocyanin
MHARLEACVAIIEREGSRMNRWQQFGSLLTLGALVGLGFGAQGTMAQDATESHPAHIHAGSCTQLGDVVYPLTNVSPSGMMAGMQAMAATPSTGMPAAMATPGGLTMSPAMGATTAIAVETSQTLVNASLQDLLSKPYAINVHESQANIQHYIACGDLGGSMMTGSAMSNGGTLAIGLKELNNSGESGIALLYDRGSNQTMVFIYLAKGLSGTGGMATPAASAPSATSAQTMAATIKNFAYQPNPIQVSVGTKVTWTNNDSTQHTVTGTDQTVIKSPTLNPGDTYSVTFTKPGTYDYHCEFHANMHGTVVVK